MSEIPRLGELTPGFRLKVGQVVNDLRGKGYDPIIASALRTKAQQKEKVAKGYSMTTKSMHLGGSDGLSRAADIVPRGAGWNANKRYWLMLASSAMAHGCGWGGLFGLNKGLKRFTKADTKAIKRATEDLRRDGWPRNEHPAYKVVIGWDPAHVQASSNW